MHCLYLSLLLVAISPVFITGRRFNQCTLARELARQGFPRRQLPDWICLVEAESSFDTSAIGRLNRDGSKDHGLFQINDRYWCGKHGYPGGGCDVKCEDLRRSDITVASRCAQHIYDVHGFSGWEGWKAKCKNKPLPSLDPCFICEQTH